MRQAGLIAHLFNGIVAFAERLNLKYPGSETPACTTTPYFLGWPGSKANGVPSGPNSKRILLRKDELPNVQDITIDARSITRDSG